MKGTAYLKATYKSRHNKGPTTLEKREPYTHGSSVKRYICDSKRKSTVLEALGTDSYRPPTAA